MVDQSTVCVYPMAKWLILVNTLRSIGQGIMVVDLALYLNALGWSATAIGSVIAVGGLSEVVLGLFVGVYSDRFGRKPFILFYELLIATCALIGMFSTQFVLVFIAIALSGFGKAQSGSPGPCAPAQQAWLATFIQTSERGKIYSFNNALGFFGMATGALLAGMTALWGQGVASYQSLFGLIFVISLVTSTIILTLKSKRVQKPQDSKGMETEIQKKNTSHKENVEVFKLASINIFNGMAVGLTGPMMAYWFAIKFGATNSMIGGTLAVTFLATGMTSLLQARLSNKYGTIRSFVWIRILASTLLILLPLLPSYTLVSFIYIIQTALNRGTQGAQQALSVSLTRDNRRGFASSVNTLSMRVPSSIGSYLSGYLFGLGTLSLPFFIASGLQFCFANFYGKTFRSYDVRMKTKPSTGVYRE